MTDKMISFRCPDYLIEKIEAFAAQHRLSASAAIRNLISMELDREETVVDATAYLKILSSLGYENISDIPTKNLDEVVRLFLQEGKKQ